MKRAHASSGFTLVELLVALFAMAVLAVMSWRGLDGMSRAQAQTEARSDEMLTLQIGLAQWSADLDALLQLPQTTALDWNGRVLRMTRRGTGAAADGALVVAWTRRMVNGSGTWLRWQSAPLTTRGELEQAWQQADSWSRNPGDDQRAREVAVMPLDDWQIFYFRGDAWTNPLSSDAAGVAAAAAAAAVPAGVAAALLPDGVRLVLSLPPGPAIGGQLTRDWVNPTLARAKS
ncbi:MAG TPA: prepilin-type N-terminal cleavage/methylation domain-containing protein [Ramlibacter sp.]|nr:prepilin-type N-terminal cleavage/methylation domain-containing protein [Ramlibacter sp.]